LVFLPSSVIFDAAIQCHISFCSLMMLFSTGRNPDAGAPVISARFPAVLAGLTSLVTFNAPNQNLWGLFPKEIFQFPNLTAINLKGTPVTIEWPTSAASQLINDMYVFV
jgi:hypothetical protein